jgi:hypothetical protein
MLITRARRCAIVAALSALTTSVGAQSTTRDDAVSRAPGVWRVRDATSPSASPALRRMDTALARTRAVVAAVPSLNPPRGLTVFAQQEVHQRSAALMVGGSLQLLLVPHDRRADGSVDASGRGEGLAMSIVANDISCMLGDKTDWSDREGTIYAAIPVAQFHDLPMYRDNACIVVTNRPAPPTVPASRGRVLRAMIANYHEIPAVSNALASQLARMSKEEQELPAYVDMDIYTSYALNRVADRSPFSSDAPHADAGIRGPNVIALVEPNRAFYDRARLGDPQVLIVSFPCGGQHDSPWCAQFPGVFERVRDSLDWKRLRALLP